MADLLLMHEFGKIAVSGGPMTNSGDHDFRRPRNRRKFPARKPSYAVFKAILALENLSEIHSTG
jgi:hypothetical protein